MNSDAAHSVRLTDAQRAKLSARLSLSPDRSDRGQLLPATATALSLPAASISDQAERALVLARALLSERLIVPVPVEVHPDHSGEHRPQGLGEEDAIPLPVIQIDSRPAVLAFSSAEELAKWDPSARPMTMSSQRVAMAASQAGTPPAIIVDAASDAPIILPVGAVHSLIGSDVWLPAWADTELRSELTKTARSACEDIVGIAVVPADGTGGLEVTVLVRVDSATDSDQKRRELVGALARLQAHPRLQAAAPSVKLVPKPVAVA